MATFLLAKQRILITRAPHQATKFEQLIRQHGGEPILFPTITIVPMLDNKPFVQALHSLSRYNWLIFTSVNAVTVFFQQLTAQSINIDTLSHLKLATIGSATATVLQNHHQQPDIVPVIHTATGLLDALKQEHDLTDQSFFLPQADIARPTLADGLRALGAQVSAIAAYRTIPLEHGPYPPPVDIVTFTSPSTVQGYVNCLDGDSPIVTLANCQVICIGPVTAEAAQTLDVPVTAIATPHTIQGLVDTMLRL
ncbi:uroporphyrinogen-III synthase [Anaerolineales bacterium HSG25]|nr:uroporphyrinogen-III synthase [Anaerolineales bacterium HSG25]